MNELKIARELAAVARELSRMPEKWELSKIIGDGLNAMKSGMKFHMSSTSPNRKGAYQVFEFFGHLYPNAMQNNDAVEVEFELSEEKASLHLTLHVWEDDGVGGVTGYRTGLADVKMRLGDDIRNDIKKMVVKAVRQAKPEVKYASMNELRVASELLDVAKELVAEELVVDTEWLKDVALELKRRLGLVGYRPKLKIDKDVLLMWEDPKYVPKSFHRISILGEKVLWEVIQKGKVVSKAKLKPADPIRFVGRNYR